MFLRNHQPYSQTKGILHPVSEKICTSCHHIAPVVRLLDSIGEIGMYSTVGLLPGHTPIRVQL